MQPHTKNYYKHFGLGLDDIVLCEYCEAQAVDIHHIVFKSQLGGDEVENLIALCRHHHLLAHANRDFNDSLKNIVLHRNLEQNG